MKSKEIATKVQRDCHETWGAPLDRMSFVGFSQRRNHGCRLWAKMEPGGYEIATSFFSGAVLRDCHKVFYDGFFNSKVSAGKLFAKTEPGSANFCVKAEPGVHYEVQSAKTELRGLLVPEFYKSCISSHKSFQVGLKAFISFSFAFLFPALICFSLAIANSIRGKNSYHTILLQLYFAVKLVGYALVRCSKILGRNSEVTPVYNTLLY